MSPAFLPWFLFPTKKTVKDKADVTHPWWCDCWSGVRKGVGITAHCVWEEWWKLMVLHTRPVMRDVLLSFRGSFGMTSHLSVREGLPEWICTWKGGFFTVCNSWGLCDYPLQRWELFWVAVLNFHIQWKILTIQPPSLVSKKRYFFGEDPLQLQLNRDWTVTRDMPLAAFLSFFIWELPIGFPSRVNLISAHSLSRHEMWPWEEGELEFPQASLVQCL